MNNVKVQLAKNERDERDKKNKGTTGISKTQGETLDLPDKEFMT